MFFPSPFPSLYQLPSDCHYRINVYSLQYFMDSYYPSTKNRLQFDFVFLTDTVYPYYVFNLIKWHIKMAYFIGAKLVNYIQ